MFFFDCYAGMLYHTFAILLGIVFPVAFAVIRLLFSGQSMNWYVYLHMKYHSPGLLENYILRKKGHICPSTMRK